MLHKAPGHNSRNFRKVALLVCGVIALIRLVTLGFPDLIDTTEGRYAGVAQLMLERDDWVTPWINYHGVEKPYLGKPPLHFWLMQISYIIFGENNFAARFPSFLSAVGIVWLIWHASRVLLGIEGAIVAASVLGSSCMLFFLGGAVVLDVTLTFGITLALVAYLLRNHSRIWGYLVFVGLGIGVLVKGPLAVVLVGGIIVPWMIAQRYAPGQSSPGWPTGCLRLPWIRGIALFLAIVVPWYLWAEQRNPGFLKYFLWNENFGRYLKSDYGDEYGTGHRQPFGASFGMMILGTFPWSLILLAILSLQPKRLLSKESALGILRDSPLLFALGWALSCPVLLLGAKQYTATYLMPSIPGFALLVAVCWERQSRFTLIDPARITRCLIIGGVLLSLIGLIGAFVLHWYGASLLSSCVVAVLSLLAIGFFWRLITTVPPFRVVCQLALLTTFIFGATTWCAHNYLSDNRSTKRVLRLVRTLVPREMPVRIGLPYYVPFSASFYSRATPDTGINLVPLKEGEIDGAHVDLFVIRRRNTQKFREETGIASIEAQVGQWRIIKNETTAP